MFVYHKYLLVIILALSCPAISAQSLSTGYLLADNTTQLQQYPAPNLSAVPERYNLPVRSPDSIYSYTRRGHRKSTVETLIVGAGLLAAGSGLITHASQLENNGSPYILSGGALALAGTGTFLTGSTIYIVELYKPAPHKPAIYKYDPHRLRRKRNSALILSIVGGAVAVVYTTDAISHRKLAGQGRIIGIAGGTSLSVLEAARYVHFRRLLQRHEPLRTPE